MENSKIVGYKNDDLTEKMKEMLRKPLPDKAISQHPTKPYLSTIKAIYIVERLNEVFGIGGWNIENEAVTVVKSDSATRGDMVVMKSIFRTRDYNLMPIEQFGGNDNIDLGDAYKGAATDALSKIGSYLEIGMDVYKGLVKAPAKGKSPAAGKTDSIYTLEDNEVPF